MPSLKDDDCQDVKRLTSDTPTSKVRRHQCCLNIMPSYPKVIACVPKNVRIQGGVRTSLVSDGVMLQVLLSLMETTIMLGRCHYDHGTNGIVIGDQMTMTLWTQYNNNRELFP